MKPRFLIIATILCLTVLASCSNGPSSGVSINASSQKDQWFSAGRRTQIDITDMDPTVLYAVKTKNGSSRGIVSRDTDSSDNILTTEAGTHIPVPDENNSCNFVGSDIDITSSKDEIQLVELKAGTDFTLVASGEPDFITEEGERVWEEYYYVDFTQPPYDFTQEEKTHLTLSIIGTGSGSGGSDWAMVSTNFKAIVDEESGFFGAFDLSDYQDVILYNKVGILSGEDWTQTILLRPTTMIKCDSTTTEINSFYDVLQVDASTAIKGKEYVLVMKTYEDGWYALKECSSEMTAFLNGRSRGFAVPIKSNETDAAVVYLGEIDPEKDFLIDFPIYSTDREPRHYADVYIREINDYEKNISRVTLSSSGTTVVTVDVPAGQNFKNPMMVYAEEGASKNDLYINVKCNYLNDDNTLGDFFGEGYVETYLNLSHEHGVGMSGLAMYGPCATRTASNGDLLENFCLYANASNSTRNLRFTITITHSDKPLEDDIRANEDGWDVLVIPNNGSANYTVRVKTAEKYGIGTMVTPSAPSRAGYQFNGWSMFGTLYGAGQTINVDFNNNLVAVWQKN